MLFWWHEDCLRFQPMRQTLLVAFALASASACSGDDSLAVAGALRVQEGGTETGFAFDRRTNLLDADLADPEDTRLRGRCVIGRDEAGEDLVAFAIARGPGVATGLGVGAFSARARRDGRGDVQVELDGAAFSASASATCEITLPYALRGDGIAALELDCSVSDGTRTAQVTADLSFEGCSTE